MICLGDAYPGLPQPLAQLPPVLDAAAVATLTGMSTWKIYDAARSGQLPPELAPVRVGRRLAWPTARVLQYLGLLDSRRDDRVLVLADETCVCLESAAGAFDAS